MRIGKWAAIWALWWRFLVVVIAAVGVCAGVVLAFPAQAQVADPGTKGDVITVFAVGILFGGLVVGILFGQVALKWAAMQRDAEDSRRYAIEMRRYNAAMDRDALRTLDPGSAEAERQLAFAAAAFVREAEDDTQGYEPGEFGTWEPLVEAVDAYTGHGALRLPNPASYDAMYETYRRELMDQLGIDESVDAVAYVQALEAVAARAQDVQDDTDAQALDRLAEALSRLDDVQDAAIEKSAAVLQLAAPH